MPPSMLSSEALVIWMFRIAMKAPIIAARMEIQTTGLARSGFCGAALGAVHETAAGAERARLAMASPLRSSRVGNPWAYGRLDGIVPAPLGLDGRDHGHARAKLDRSATF